MTYEEKLSIIVEAIKEARQFTRKEYLTKLHIGTGNGLSRIPLPHIQDILLQLQDDGKIIILKELPTGLKPVTSQASDLMSGSKNYFLIDILTNFDDWYANYKLKQKSKVENLSEENLKEVSYVLSQIESQLQLSQSNKFNFCFINSKHDIEGYENEDIDELMDGYIKVFDYLKKIKVIKSYSHGVMSLDADIELNINNFFDLLDKIKKIKLEKNQKDTSVNKTTKNTSIVKEDNDVIYKIVYTKQRQIILNNDTQIANPDFNSENDLVFSFLYENPYKKFTKEKIEQAIGNKLNKSFHKIIENLGFEGDTKKLFFSVSKNAIEFRNPITKRDLEEIKQPLTKMIKGGGKLVLPLLHR